MELYSALINSKKKRKKNCKNLSRYIIIIILYCFEINSSDMNK